MHVYIIICNVYCVRCTMYIKHNYFVHTFYIYPSIPYSLCMCTMQCIYNIYNIIPKTKKFGCVGRGDLTCLFRSCEIYESQGRLIYSCVAYIHVRSRAKYLKFRTTTSKFNTLRKLLMQKKYYFIHEM